MKATGVVEVPNLKQYVRENFISDNCWHGDIQIHLCIGISWNGNAFSAWNRVFSQDCNVWLRSYDVATRSYAGYGDIVAVVIATATATATRKYLATATVSYGYAKKIWLRLRSATATRKKSGYGYATATDVAVAVAMATATLSCLIQLHSHDN